MFRRLEIKMLQEKERNHQLQLKHQILLRRNKWSCQQGLLSIAINNKIKQLVN